MKLASWVKPMARYQNKDQVFVVKSFEVATISGVKICKSRQTKKSPHTRATKIHTTKGKEMRVVDVMSMSVRMYGYVMAE